MQSKSMMFALFSVCLALVGCDGPEATWVYGQWNEKLDGGTVEFRQDGTVSWFGTEGTFSFNRATNVLCFDRCPDGELHIDADSQSFRVPYRTNSNSRASWSMNFQSYGGTPATHTLEGKQIKALYLSAAENFEGPYRPEGFERFDNGTGYLYNNMTNSGIVNGQMVGQIWWGTTGLVRYDESAGSWVDIAPDGMVDHVGTIHTGAEVILNDYVFSNKYSIDTGDSWQSLPALSDVLPGVAGRDPVLLGKRLYQLVDQPVEDGGDWSQPRPHWLYRVDLSKGSPEWTRVYDFPTDLTTDKYYFNLYGSEAVGELYAFAIPSSNNGEPDPSLEIRMFRSQDLGSSWEELDAPTPFSRVNDVEETSTGIVMTISPKGDSNSQIVAWFDADTASWSELTLGQGEHIYGFAVQGDTLVNWNWSNRLTRMDRDGTVTTIFEYGNEPSMPGHGHNLMPQNDFQSPQVQVVGDEIFYCDWTIWRLVD